MIVTTLCFMRLMGGLALLAFSGSALIAADLVASSQEIPDFSALIATKLVKPGKANPGALPGIHDWLFIYSDLRFLSHPQFWGADAAKVSQAPKPELADPLPAIIDFNRQLAARGIHLLVVPIPPKVTIYPEKLFPETPTTRRPSVPALARFYEVLRGNSVDVLDLTSLFLENRESEHGNVFCKTDSHWSGAGCALAAKEISQRVRTYLDAQTTSKKYQSEWVEKSIDGDLAGLITADASKRLTEKIQIRVVSEQGVTTGIQPDPQSPVLLLGDSHTLVFHDFLAERAGLLDQLSVELGSTPDLIGTRGSGATPVRVSLYRRSLKDPEFLAKKKVVIWCFAAREFTEADQGWAKLPISK